MSWKFNPPPGWQIPAGWQPPAGYVPDPSWPPAPAGWQFWVPDASTSGGTPAEAAMEPAGPGTAGPPASQPPPPQPFPATIGAPATFGAPATIGAPAGAMPPGPLLPVATPWYQHWWAIAGGFLIMLLLGCAIGGLLATLAS